MKLIGLTRGYEALVDDDVFTMIRVLHWHAHVMDYTVYARRFSGSRIVWMHNVVVQPIGDLSVDHIDGNGLNNQRSNLRLVTKSQQQINRTGWNPTGMKGVYQTPSGRWQARIAIGGKREHLGMFDTKDEAAAAYKAAALKLHGPFVRKETD